MKNKIQTGKIERANTVFSREFFIETIGEIKKQHDHDQKCGEAFKVILPDDYISLYDNHFLHNQLVKTLQLLFDDAHPDSWIEYFLYELDYGKDYKKGCATNEDGSNINLSSAGHLYDFLVKEIKNKK